MRKLVNSTYISLDGVVEQPHVWPSNGIEDERDGQIQSDLLFSCDALLMGRRTYEGFEPVWTTRSDPFSDYINSMRKYVVSSTLRDPSWENTVVIDADPVGAVRELKRQPGKDLVQYGFGVVSRALLAAGLIDELRLWIHPLFVGSGGPGDLIYGEVPLTQVELEDTISLKSGIVVLSYRVTG